MRLPANLNQAIEREIEKSNPAELSQAVADLTQRYKTGRLSSPAVTSPAHRAAYLTVRFPATLAANLRVFDEIRRFAPEEAITGMLDLGAGPGTSAYAAAEMWPSLRRVTLVEADSSFIELGRRLSRESPHAAIRDAGWLQANLKALPPLEQHDLVVISYVLNELSSTQAHDVITQAWQRTGRFLVIVEPGTMRGFGFVHAARSQLIAAGAHIPAPCPHTGACPMAAAGDWCHFAQRVERTSLHRRLKSGALGYEDEKFSYLVASKSLLPPAPTRIVRRPQKHTGHVQLVLCTPQGLERRTVGKSKKDIYKAARKAEWGDRWE
jgi:ribosomal protein RSM22 (predicted rRNA methylase)